MLKVKLSVQLTSFWYYNMHLSKPSIYQQKSINPKELSLQYPYNLSGT